MTAAADSVTLTAGARKPMRDLDSLFVISLPPPLGTRYQPSPERQGAATSVLSSLGPASATGDGVARKLLHAPCQAWPRRPSNGRGSRVPSPRREPNNAGALRPARIEIANAAIS